MEILFVVDNISDYCGPTVNIALTIARKLRQMKHNVYVLSRKDDNYAVSEYKKNIFCDAFFVHNDQVDRVNRFRKAYDWSNIDRKRKLQILMRHPFIWSDFILCRSKGDQYFYVKNFKRELRRLFQKNKYDVVLSFAFPYYVENVVAFSEISAIKVLCQMDPYVHNSLMPKEKIEKRKKEQNDILMNVDIVFVPKVLYGEYVNDDCPYIDKMVPFQLPGIISDEERVIRENNSDKTTIGFYFVGFLYDKIRSPKFTLELFLRLPKEYVLHIVGAGSEEVLERYKNKLGDRLVIHGSVSNEEAKRIMRDADILVNINNSISNQIPSKVFDYINTGNPILNICKISECPSNEYIGRYPLGFTVFEKDEINDVLIDSLTSFIKKSIGKTVSRGEILDKYYDCTDDYVTNQILNQISRNSR